MLTFLHEPTAERLDDVAKLAARCAELADKQLAGKPFTRDDDAWFLNYGRKLAGIAGYVRDADDQPQDDAPRITDVVYDTEQNRYRVAAVGRPRALWMLYPHAGQEVLCRGAVFPYYEFFSPDRPSDDAWQQSVRAGKQPAPPAWLKPLLRPGTPDPAAESKQTGG